MVFILALFHLERTAPVAMTAPEAGIRPDGKFLVVVRSHFIARKRQIVILVHDADIDTVRE